jgi:hypothetical protein
MSIHIKNITFEGTKFLQKNLYYEQINPRNMESNKYLSPDVKRQNGSVLSPTPLICLFLEYLRKFETELDRISVYDFRVQVWA